MTARDSDRLVLPDRDDAGLEAEFLIAPDPEDPRLTRAVEGIDQTGARVETRVTMERPLTLYLKRSGDRHDDDDRRPSGIPGARLPAEPEHAAAGRHGHGGAA